MLPLLILLSGVPSLGHGGIVPKCVSLADSVIQTVRSSSDFPSRLARRLAEECRNNHDAMLRAGQALSELTHPVNDTSWAYQPAGEWAERFLGRATQLDKNDPTAWAGYGLLLRKRTGVQENARRALERAVALARDHPISDSLLSRAHGQLGALRQDWLDRFRWLKDAAAIPVSTPACLHLGAFCENYQHPAAFNQALLDAASLEGDQMAGREDVVAHLRNALDLDRANVEAAERYGRELALGEEWETLVALAGDQQRQGAARGFFFAVEALGADRLGHDRLADSLFRLALPLLPDSLRPWYQNPPPGVDSVPDYWERNRPLWVVGFNEALLEYRTRLTYAQLVFVDRAGGVPGPETPQGDALIRYGWPRVLVQVDRDMTRFISPTRLIAMMDIDRAAESGRTVDRSTGRWVFWTYDPSEPSFVFEQRPGFRVSRAARESQAETFAELARQERPFQFHSRMASRQFTFPAQIVRFRGPTPDQTAIAVYGVVPTRLMEVPHADSVAVGFFLMRDTVALPVIREEQESSQAGDRITSTFQVTVGAGHYRYSLEALAVGSAIAATARDSLLAPTWNSDSVSMSDVLIAHDVHPIIPSPKRRIDLQVEPSRTLRVPPGSTIWLVWEIYGVRPTPLGVAKYRVTVALRDSRGQSLPVRLLARLGLANRERRPVARLEWQSQRTVASDGRALEFVALTLPDDAIGSYVVEVTVTDLDGRGATGQRAIVLERP